MYGHIPIDRQSFIQAKGHRFKRFFSLMLLVGKVNTYFCGYSVIMSDVELIMWVSFTVMSNPLKTEIYPFNI